MKKLTIDSSVIVASLLANEPRHEEAFRIWESVLSGVNTTIMPYSSSLGVRSCNITLLPPGHGGFELA